MLNTERPNAIDRRTVIAGTAWAVPAVLVSSALPAFAASRTVTTASVVSAVASEAGGNRRATVTFGLETNDGTPLAVGTEATFKLVVTSTFLISTPTVDPAPGTVPSGFTLSDPAGQTVPAGGTVTFLTTLQVTEAQTLSSADATMSLQLPVTVIPGSTFQLRVTASVESATAAPSNGTVIVDTTARTAP